MTLLSRISAEQPQNISPPAVNEGPNHLLATPKKEDELRQLISTIEAKVTP
jgi:hypothetical protein